MCRGPTQFLDDARILGPSIPNSVRCDPYTYSNGNGGTVTAISIPAQACIGQRTSDGKYQLLMTNLSINRTHIGYFIVYNGSDPTATVFSSVAEVNDYLNANFVTSPPSKLFDSHISEDVKTTYTSIIAASFYPSSYSNY